MRCEALESPHRLRIAIRPHGDVMRTIAHIDALSVGMDHLHDPGPPIVATAPVLFSLFGSAAACLSFLFSSGEIGIGFGPVTNGL
jgi:hypothetical protein